MQTSQIKASGEGLAFFLQMAEEEEGGGGGICLFSVYVD